MNLDLYECSMKMDYDKKKYFVKKSCQVIQFIGNNLFSSIQLIFSFFK